MRKSIDTYVQGIAHDNAESIINGYDSIADYIISTAENGTGYEEFFDNNELDETGEPTQEQIDELKAYLNENYDYLPECNLEDIAAQNGLELIDTTSARNGYPQDLQKAIIGFDTFEQAEKLAKETGLRIEFFQQHDGWDSGIAQDGKRVSLSFVRQKTTAMIIVSFPRRTWRGSTRTMCSPWCLTSRISTPFVRSSTWRKRLRMRSRKPRMTKSLLLVVANITTPLKSSPWRIITTRIATLSD